MTVRNSAVLPQNGHQHELPHWLMVGIGGAGMRAFSEMLLDAGHRVVGTDQNPDVLHGTHFAPSMSISTVPWDDEFPWNQYSLTSVVHSLAVPASAQILETARRRGVAVMSLPEALGRFVRDSRQTCVAGTHGKTTTTGMIWWILNQARLAPTGYIGGEFCNLRKTGAFGPGEISVIESCEYREAFLSLMPQNLVLTGVEADHFDCFKNQQQADSSYSRFIEKLPPNGNLIVNAASPRATAMARQSRCSTITYGLGTASDWRASQLSASSSKSPVVGNQQSFQQTFRLDGPIEKSLSVTIQVPGAHNVENAMAAIIAVTQEGISPDEAASHLSSFPGMRRRFEYRGHWRGIDLIDDYAHHPTAILATLRTARAVFPGRKLIAIFEPHQISRTLNLFPEFAKSLAIADECLILPVLAARETATLEACRDLSGQLAREISVARGRAFLLTNLDQVLGRLDYAARSGDVVITMGAGRTHQIHDEINRRLQRDSAA